MIVERLVAGALRKLGVLAAGATVDAAEGEEALSAVQNMYLEMVGSGLFGRQCDVAVPQGSVDFVARPGGRFVAEDLAAVGITLPEFVQDTWWRWDYGRCWRPAGTITAPSYVGYRPPLDGAIVTAADLSSTTTRTYVYDAALARWTDLQSLTMADDAPLATRYGEGLMCELAIRLAPEYGQSVTPSIARGQAQGRSAMTGRWDGPERTVRGVFF